MKIHLALTATLFVCRAICDAEVSDRHVSGRLDGSVYRTLSSMGEIKCAEHCLRSSNCLSVNYKRSHLTCELNTQGDKTALTPDTSWVYLDKDDLLQMWSDKTCAVQCSSRHTCVELTSQQRTCVRTECTDPPSVSNGAVAVYKVGVSEKVVYTCNTHYQFTGSGNGQLTCKADGTFVNINFACDAIPCPYPPNVANAVLTSYNHAVGGRAYYNCNFGYSTLDSREIQCLLGGYWSSVGFQCQLFLIFG